MKMKKNTKISDNKAINRIKNGEVILCLSRHGESEANLDISVHKHTRDSDIKMTLNGKEQIKNVSIEQRNLFQEITLACDKDKPERFSIFSSPYARAQESATILANELLKGKKALLGTITTSNLLTEQEYGLANGCLSFKQFAERTHGEQELLDRMGDYFYSPPRGESRRDVYVRCGLFVEKVRWFIGTTFNIVCAHKVVCQEMERYILGTTSDSWFNAETKVYIINPSEHKAVNWGIIKP